MRCLFLSAPLLGHLDWGGYQATAAELVRRGHTVLWASGDAVRQQLEQAGVPFTPLITTGWRWPPPPPLKPPAPQDTAAWQVTRAGRALDQWLDPERVTRAIAEILPLAREFQPDVIVTEMFVAASGFVAELLQRPLVVAGWPAVQAQTAGSPSPLMSEARVRLDDICRHWQVAGCYWSHAGPPALLSPFLHITYWSPTWYQHLSVLSQTRHAGGRAPTPLPPDRALPDPAARPWVLITLGTSFNDDPAFFANAARAADQMGCLPIVALGRPVETATFGTLTHQLPNATRVLAWVNFPAVLPYVAAAIHHGGAGTTHALVTSAVPQIVVPHAADQVHQADGVARSGIGFHIGARQATVDNLANALAALLPDLSPYRAAAQVLQAEFAALGGAYRAADWIEEVGQHCWPTRGTTSEPRP